MRHKSVIKYVGKLCERTIIGIAWYSSVPVLYEDCFSSLEYRTLINWIEN